MLPALAELGACLEDGQAQGEQRDAAVQHAGQDDPSIERMRAIGGNPASGMALPVWLGPLGAMCSPN